MGLDAQRASRPLQAHPCGGAFPAVVDAVRSYLPGATVRAAAGVPSVLSDDTSQVAAAAALAGQSDATVLVLGTDLGVAMENRDAVNITFSDGQLALVEAVAAAVAAPLTVVTLTAVPLDLAPLLRNPKVGAILHAGQPSVQTLGVADLLFGARSPAGRAVQVFCFDRAFSLHPRLHTFFAPRLLFARLQMVYPSAYQHQISPFDFGMRPGPSAWPRSAPPPRTPPPLFSLHRFPCLSHIYPSHERVGAVAGPTALGRAQTRMCSPSSPPPTVLSASTPDAPIGSSTARQLCPSGARRISAPHSPNRAHAKLTHRFGLSFTTWSYVTRSNRTSVVALLRHARMSLQVLDRVGAARRLPRRAGPAPPRHDGADGHAVPEALGSGPRATVRHQRDEHGDCRRR